MHPNATFACFELGSPSSRFYYLVKHYMYYFEFSRSGFPPWEDKRSGISKLFLSFFILGIFLYTLEENRPAWFINSFCIALHWEKFVYLLLHSWIASCVYYYGEGAFEVFWPYEGPPHYIYDAAAGLLGLVVVVVMMVFAAAIHKTNPKEGYNFGGNQIKCWDYLCACFMFL